MFREDGPTKVLLVSMMFAVLCFLQPDIGEPQGVTSSTPQGSGLSVPSGWSVFRGAKGLIVLHPRGWQVQERADGAFLAFRPGLGGIASALVMVEPFSRFQGRSVDILQTMGQWRPDLFPAVTVSRVRLLSQFPDVAVGQLRYRVQGEPFKGAAMCFKKGDQGVFYAMASRESAWPQEESVMREILSRFFYTGEEGPGGPSPSTPDMVPWSDPNEGAFTCPAPRGWKVEGGLVRLAPLDTKLDVLMTSPDEKILIRLGDSSVPSVYVLPSPVHEMGGFTEGSWYSPDGLHKMMVMRYLPGASFLTEFYLPQRVGRVSNIQIKEYPEISQKLRALHAPLARIGGMTYHADAAEVAFDAETEKGTRKGVAFAVTSANVYQMGATGGMWWVNWLGGFLAVPGLESLAKTLAERVGAGFQWNPQWQQQMTKLAGNVSKIQSQTHGEIMNMIHQGYERRSQIMDRVHERWTRAFRGQVLIEDPHTGDRFEVPAGSNYYWRIGGSQEFVGTETSSPELPNYWLHEMRIVD